MPDLIEIVEAVKKQKIVGGTIKGVHILGFTSKNKRTYNKEAVEAAVDSYNGVEVYLNHESEEATLARADNITAKFAVIKNCKFVESQGVVGDLDCCVKHPMFPAIEWWAENYPNRLGLSHIAQCLAKEGIDGTQEVIEIRKPKFVDLVSRPATTSGLFAESYKLCTEGVVDDKIQEGRLSAIWSAISSLYYDKCYPSAYYSAPPQTKPLTDAERAVLLIPVLQDAVKELKLLAATTKSESVQPNITSKESDMDIKDVTLEMLRKEKPELVSLIATEAVNAEKAIDVKVVEAIKDLPLSAQTKPFIKLVRESIVRNEDVTEMVADRKQLVKVEAVESAQPNKPVTVAAMEAKESESTTITDDAILAAFNK